MENIGEVKIKMNKEKDTWQNRFIAEYKQLKERYNKLHKTIVQLEAGTCDFKPECSLDLLKRQAKAMGEYLFVLEMRSEIECIDLETGEYYHREAK